jgi:hypothetical protein
MQITYNGNLKNCVMADLIYSHLFSAYMEIKIIRGWTLDIQLFCREPHTYRFNKPENSRVSSFYASVIADKFFFSLNQYAFREISKRME